MSQVAIENILHRIRANDQINVTGNEYIDSYYIPKKTFLAMPVNWAIQNSTT